MGNMFAFGEYVVYEPGENRKEIGRVVRDDGQDFVFACFCAGCSDAAVPRNMLRAATETEIAEAETHIGGYRFDEHCPSYDKDACFLCEHAR